MTLFARPEEQVAIRDIKRAFSDEKFAPYALKWDEDRRFPVDVMRKAASLGMGGIGVRDDHGGSGLARLDPGLIFEACSTGCPIVSYFVKSAWMIDRYGSEEQRARWLSGLRTVKLLAAYALTEPGSGSDSAALRNATQRDGDDYVLNGSKQLISGVGAIDPYVVMGRTGCDGPNKIATVSVKDGTVGPSFGPIERKMVWSAQPARQIVCQDCQASMSNRVDDGGTGFQIVVSGLDGGQQDVGACSLGGAQSALDKLLAHMRNRRAFGRRLENFKRSSFDSRTWRPTSKPRACSCAQRQPPLIEAIWTRHSIARRRKVSKPTRFSGSRTTRFNFTVATATCPNTGPRASSATCASTKSFKARTRSCV